MSAFLYGTALQWKLDIRSRSLLITCYVVPLLFFVVVGGIFTFLDPNAKNTLIQSMTVMGISMGSLIGLPPSLVEIYSSDIKKVYQANGVPLYLGLISTFLSAFLHLMLMSMILACAAPLIYHAALPANLAAYFGALAIFTAVSLSIGSFLGLAVKSQAKLTMVSQILFLPSMLLSGIMFPANLLPRVLEVLGKLLPASWGFLLMKDGGFLPGNLWPLAILAVLGIAGCAFQLKKIKTD